MVPRIRKAMTRMAVRFMFTSLGSGSCGGGNGLVGEAVENDRAVVEQGGDEDE
jgi:hypothetical protein